DQLEVRLQLLHHALEDALGAGALDLDLDAGVGGLEELADLLGRRQRQRGVPDDLAFLLRGLYARVLRRDGRGEDDPDRGEQTHEDTQSFHELYPHRVSVRVRVRRSGSPSSARPLRMTSEARASDMTRLALPRNFDSISSRVIDRKSVV